VWEETAFVTWDEYPKHKGSLWQNWVKLGRSSKISTVVAALVTHLYIGLRMHKGSVPLSSTADWLFSLFQLGNCLENLNFPGVSA
jgi:hypothetical protein